MSKTNSAMINNFIKHRKFKNIMILVSLFLSVIVLVGVTMLMMKPAITSTKTNPEISVETTEEVLGGEISLKVKATGDNSNTCFVLTFDGESAGLSDTYNFTNEQVTITDIYKNNITLNREIGEDKVVNYYFNLENGQKTEFELSCTSGVYVITNEEREQYLSLTSTDDEAIRNAEVEEMIAAENIAKTEELTEASLNIKSGSGADLALAKLDTVTEETLTLTWIQEDRNSRPRLRSALRGEVITEGAVSETVFYEITKDVVSGSYVCTVYGDGPIPDFTSASYAPWYSYRTSIVKIIIEDGITQIGNNAFNYYSYIKELYIGNTVERIGSSSFSRCGSLRSIHVPASVKRIENNAFENCKAATSLILEEGLEYIGESCFAQLKVDNIHIPSTVTSFIKGNMPYNESYTVGEGSTKYFAEDGVLYEYRDDGNIRLLSYPMYKPDAEFSIPDYVYEIANSAFSSVQSIKKLTIPSSVQTSGTTYVIMKCCALEEVLIEEGARFSYRNSYFFISCYSLQTVEMIDSPTSEYFNFNDCPSIESIHYPTNVTRIAGGSFNANTPALKTVYFNSIKCTEFGPGIEVPRKYDLTVGKDVDYLKGTESGLAAYDLNNGFQALMVNAKSLKFESENQIKVSAGVFEKLPAPYNNIKDTIWVDSQGIVYSYNKSALTASVSYVPFDLKEVVIPKTITPESGVTCTVNSVDDYAFKLAENLETLSFEDPSVIEKIGAYGISYCNKLSSVNGVSTMEEAKESFTNENILIGYRTFYFTSLTTTSEIIDYDNVNGVKNAVVVTEKFEPLNIYVYDEGGLWKDAGDIGNYTTLTGNTVSINMAMNSSDIQFDKVFRVYFEMSADYGYLSISPGETKTIAGTEITCYKTEAPNVVYVEFVPTVGATINTVLESVYPTPTSAGGSMRVWGMAITKEESSENREKVIPFKEIKNSDGTIEYIDALNIQWKTQADDFKVTKTSTGNTTINIVGDGKGNFNPQKDLSYSIKYERVSEETSAYGKDYVKAVDFYDYIDFGENSGITWSSKIIDGIKNNNTRFFDGILYSDNIPVAKISNSGASLSSAYLEYDEIKGVVVHWRIYNTNALAEIATTTSTFTIYASAISVSPLALNEANVSYLITNHVDTETTYSYSEKVTATSSAEKYLSVTAGNISLSKGMTEGYASTKALNFGSSIEYKISLYNSGAVTYYGVAGEVYTLKDDMSPYTYITAENMEKMFSDEYGKTMSISIKDADIYPREAVTSQDNNKAYITGVNSNADSLKETIKLVWNSEENAIEILRTDGTSIIVENSLKEALDSIGYSVVFDTDFTVEWVLNNEEDFKLLGGQYKYFYIYANNKDTFMMLDGDYRWYYPTANEISNRNNVYLYRSGSKSYVKSAYVYTYMTREANIEKSAKLNESSLALENDFNINLEDIIDYKVRFRHYGTGEYENLPVVDNIYGVQVLLVPVEQNPQLANLNLGTVTAKENDEDVLFYKLSKSGIYEDVVVGLNENGEYMVADTVSVTTVGEETEITVDGEIRRYSGLQTSINWYFSKLEGEAYYKDINYHTYIDSEHLHSSVISAGNIVWINNKTDDRIYDYLWGTGSLLEFDKSIVVENEDGSLSVDADDHTIIANGEEVTYRLRLINPNSYKFAIRGSYFYDALPTNEDIFNWEKDVNVVLSYEESDDVNVANIDNWYIDDQMYGVYQHGKYYMKWTDETVVELDAGAVFDMYVTLKFPKNTSGTNTWTEYYRSVKGNRISNTFNVYGSTDIVYHSLKEKGSAVLQKGVYGTYRYSISSNYYSYTSTPSRVLYNNHDATRRSISYYVVLYNDGYTKLYVDNLYDQLPKGFGYLSLMSTSSPSTTVGNTINTSTSNVFADVTNISEESIKYMNASIDAVENDGVITFSVSQNLSNNSIHFDEEKNKCYLENGEAIVFGYMCDIGESTQTEDVAVNSIGMEYDDYLDAGVTLASETDVEINGKLTEVFAEQNDGDRSLEAGSELKEKYTFAKDTLDDSQWLVSDVSVTRGGIVPGVTNYTDSYINTGTDIVFPYTTGVSPFATINWRSRLHNSGTYSITDYTFVDELPAPYGLTGTVSISIYDNMTEKALKTFNIFTVEERTNTGLKVRSGDGYARTINFDGTPMSLVVSAGINAEVSVLRDENGKEILTINFKDKAFSIPENAGYADITFSTNNETNVYENTVYTNLSYLIPNVQEYDSAAQGSIVYEGNELYGVVNSSPANVSIGYSTTSQKSVEESINSENNTTSVAEKNYILLKNKQNEFKYTLTVTNDTKNGMTKLILIDSLPQVGDHSPFDKNAFRNSEFKVSLSEEPDFTLTVYPEEGESYVVSPSYYTIGYKESQDFVSEDWSGTSIWSQWSEEAENVRSIRLYVNDSTGEQIPAGAKIEFSFNAKVDDETAAAGMTAWNSFGYHYGLLGVPIELEAMPLSVGVKIPDVPTLQKQLVDLNGDSYIAEEDTSFTYRIYKGDEESEIYTDVTLTVKAGESASEKVKLILEGWEWETGESYVIAEHTGNEDYVLANWNNRLEKAYTFKYDPDVSVAIKCTNTYKKWSFEILKTDGYNDQKPLRGAVFALYSPKEEDKITDEEYARLTLKPEKIIVDENGTQWYLKEILVTDNQGKCKFNDLRQTSYYLVEIKAPDGYKLEFEPRVVTNKAISSTIEVKNYSMPKLPFTGAKQNPTVLIGGVLFGLSLFAIVFILRKRKIQNNA